MYSEWCEVKEFGIPKVETENAVRYHLRCSKKKELSKRSLFKNNFINFCYIQTSKIYDYGMWYYKLIFKPTLNILKNAKILKQEFTCKDWRYIIPNRKLDVVVMPENLVNSMNKCSINKTKLLPSIRQAKTCSKTHYWARIGQR